MADKVVEEVESEDEVYLQFLTMLKQEDEESDEEESDNDYVYHPDNLQDTEEFRKDRAVTVSAKELRCLRYDDPTLRRKTRQMRKEQSTIRSPQMNHATVPIAPKIILPTPPKSLSYYPFEEYHLEQLKRQMSIVRREFYMLFLMAALLLLRRWLGECTNHTVKKSTYHLQLLVQVYSLSKEIPEDADASIPLWSLLTHLNMHRDMYQNYRMLRITCQPTASINNPIGARHNLNGRGYESNATFDASNQNETLPGTWQTFFDIPGLSLLAELQKIEFKGASLQVLSSTPTERKKRKRSQKTLALPTSIQEISRLFRPYFHPEYLVSLLPDHKNRQIFTSCEDDLLLLGLKRFGVNEWSLIRTFYLPAKSERQISTRHKNLVSRRCPASHPIKQHHASMYRPLSSSEIETFRAAVKIHKTDFERIQRAYFPELSVKHLKQVWLLLLNNEDPRESTRLPRDSLMPEVGSSDSDESDARSTNALSPDQENVQPAKPHKTQQSSNDETGDEHEFPANENTHEKSDPVRKARDGQALVGQPLESQRLPQTSDGVHTSASNRIPGHMSVEKIITKNSHTMLHQTELGHPGNDTEVETEDDEETDMGDVDNTKEKSTSSTGEQHPMFDLSQYLHDVMHHTMGRTLSAFIQQAEAVVEQQKVDEQRVAAEEKELQQKVAREKNNLLEFEGKSWVWSRDEDRHILLAAKTRGIHPSTWDYLESVLHHPSQVIGLRYEQLQQLFEQK